MPTRIALIHAVVPAMAPVIEAFRQHWPQAHLCNILDDSLSRDREDEGRLTPAMTGRIRTLADYAAGNGAAGILFTCSAFGPAIVAAAAVLPIPVLKPNEAMFAAALRRGRRIGMLATFPPSVASMEEEFAEMAAASGIAADIETRCVPDAMTALKAGDGAGHDRLLAEAAPRLAACDTVLLAHFSTARAAAAVETALGRPILTAPGSAVTSLRAAVAASADRRMG